MLALVLFMIGFVVVASISFWASSLLLASLFPVFNFKEEYIEYYTRISGTPPSRRRLILVAYGAGGSFFMADWSHESPRPNALKLIPNKNMVRILALQFASILTALLLWIFAAFVFVLVGAYLQSSQMQRM